MRRERHRDSSWRRITTGPFDGWLVEVWTGVPRGRPTFEVWTDDRTAQVAGPFDTADEAWDDLDRRDLAAIEGFPYVSAA